MHKVWTSVLIYLGVDIDQHGSEFRFGYSFIGVRTWQ